MRAGRLDRMITIQRKTETQSDSGAPVEAWSNIVMRRAAGMVPVRGDERFTGEQVVGTEQVEFRVRYSSDIADLSQNDRIVEPALQADSPADSAEERRTYDILAVHEIGRREGLRIIAQRHPDVTT